MCSLSEKNNSEYKKNLNINLSGEILIVNLPIYIYPIRNTKENFHFYQTQ